MACESFWVCTLKHQTVTKNSYFVVFSTLEQLSNLVVLCLMCLQFGEVSHSPIKAKISQLQTPAIPGSSLVKPVAFTFQTTLSIFCMGLLYNRMSLVRGIHWIAVKQTATGDNSCSQPTASTATLWRNLHYISHSISFSLVFSKWIEVRRCLKL